MNDLRKRWDATEVAETAEGNARRRVRICRREERDAMSARIIHLQGRVERLTAVVEELIESAAYWSEYDVPLGIVERMRNALEAGK